ncbi:hypothetical protein [Aeromicrobium duanguangcaii]|uniref:hypothetical protein n=1 Tax=Aeromicrobium duanguangcaii TaxID=2968086 RepID=UPI0020178122|nr:hypothetical protein [Aeromicrobium duanguangcaii]MCL3838916.1 hypothetical protein [Aeromicrobium duanguangcaii]
MKKTILALLALVLTAGMTGLVGSPAEAATAKRSTTKTGYTQVVVAPAVNDLIGSAGITPAPVQGAKAGAFKGTLAAKFPITGYSLRGIRIKHSGGLNLSAGASTITVSNFNIDLARLRVSGNVNGTVGNVGRVDLFKVRASDRRDLGLVKLTLTKTAADALNATFGVNAFAENATFGYATPKPLSRF